MRWSIEVFLGHLKEKGFNYEETNLTDRRKINTLMAVLAICFLFTYGFGLLLKEKGPLSAAQKRKSVFWLGLDTLASIIVKPCIHKENRDLFLDRVVQDVEPKFFVV